MSTMEVNVEYLILLVSVCVSQFGLVNICRGGSSCGSGGHSGADNANSGG